MKQRYKKLSEYAIENSVTYRTAWNRFKSGKLNGAFLDETGHVVIPLFPEKPKDNNVVLYARVSNNDRKKELEYQLDRIRNYAINNGFNIIDEIKEIASSMNDDRPKLSKLLTRKDWNIIIVENKDRLTRFGYNYIDLLLNVLGKKIIVINQVNEDKQELLNDTASILHTFFNNKKNKQDILNFLEK